jgi:PleD family two-component response regulator
LRHIPVIMISAVEEIDSVIRCIELGAEDYPAQAIQPDLAACSNRREPETKSVLTTG